MNNQNQYVLNSISNGFRQNKNNNQNSDCGCDNKDFSNLELASESTVTYKPKSTGINDLRGLQLSSHSQNTSKKSSCSINNLQRNRESNHIQKNNMSLEPINPINYLDPTQAQPEQNNHDNHDSHNKGGNNFDNTVKDSYTFAIKNINLAFVLIAAFAWNDAIKYFIARLIKLDRGTPYYYLYYALIITLLAVIVFRISSRFTK